MVRINKVYTKTGDKGNTRLAGGQIVSKAGRRIEAYGTVDELNAVIGLCVEACKKEIDLNPVWKKLIRIQNELFNLGSQLAVLPEDRRDNTPVILDSDILKLEKEIDEFNTDLPSLKSFILPGGGEISARFHLARTVCRRAERCIVKLGDTEPLDGTEGPYINRLSDWLFVIARYVSYQQGIPENLWKV